MTASSRPPAHAPKTDAQARLGALVIGRIGLLVLLGLTAAVLPVLALPAGFVLWVGWLSLPRLSPAVRRVVQLTFALAGVAAAVGLVRFVIEHAAAGIVGGGQTATSRRAISRLRELVFAQDMMRKNAFLDADADGIGSAGWLGELAGSTPPRSQRLLDVPILNHEWEPNTETPLGPAVELGGYLFMICLPTDDHWTARPGQPVDEERAEREFFAYAWPAEARPGFTEVYSVDARETLLVGRPAAGRPLPYIGRSQPPPCDAAVTQELRWERWENKPPRARLPGAEP